MQLPEKQYERLQVETDNGRIIADQLQAQDIKLETDNGRIELKHVDATTVDVKTDNGKIILENVEGRLRRRLTMGKFPLLQTI